MNRKELEDRLISFSIMIIDLKKSISGSETGRHLFSQLMRASTSSALNYGEAQAGASIKDFTHKLTLVVKELKECNVGLRILMGAELSLKPDNLVVVLKENVELVAIFTASIKTATQKHLVNYSNSKSTFKIKNSK